MKKCYAFLVAIVVVFAITSSGCSGFKGFCDRGSLFPTRQPQLVPTQSVYSVAGDMCCPGEVMSVACDPCGGASSSRPVFSEPVATYP